MADIIRGRLCGADAEFVRQQEWSIPVVANPMLHASWRLPVLNAQVLPQGKKHHG
jgi:hypothetical protein